MTPAFNSGRFLFSEMTGYARIPQMDVTTVHGAWWCMPVIPALGRLRHKNCEAS
jgi:hypothetical protein